MNLKGVKMTHRLPSNIMKEIKRVSKLIRENQELMVEYPEEVGLELDQWALKARKAELLEELRQSDETYNVLMFDLELKDKRFPNLGLDKVGSFFTSLNELMIALVQSITSGAVKKGAKASELIKELARLNIVDASPGSLNIVLNDQQNMKFGESPSKQALNKLNILINCGDDKDLILQQMEKLGNKPIIKYKEFLGVIIENDMDLTLYKHFKPKDYNTQIISKTFAEKVYKVIIETTPKTETEIIKGILGAVNTFSKEITIKTNNEVINGEVITGKKISIKFAEDFLPLIKSKLKERVTVKVNVTNNYQELEDNNKETRELINFIE